jgi:hypothetical protein
MTLRFEVNQAEAFRQGVNVEKSTQHLEVDPAALSQEERNLIADRLSGIDLVKLEVRYDGTVVKSQIFGGFERPVGRIEAKLPTYEALMAAIRENAIQVQIDVAAKIAPTK